MISNDHNVYILGAGFSFDAGIPLVTAFMNRMRDAHPWLVSQGRDDEAKAVERVLSFRLASANAAYRVKIDVENIEELFSLASSLAGAAGDLTESDVRLAIAATIDFAAAGCTIPGCELKFEAGVTPVHGWPASTERQSSAGGPTWLVLPVYDFVLAVMTGTFSEPNEARRNTIITFNYDMVVENALSTLEVPFSYGFKGKTVNYGDDAPVAHGPGSETALRLLKLHGSLNWAVTGKRGGKLTVFKDYASLRAAGCVPTLVPPTWRKTFAKQLDDIWQECASALSSATRVIVVGFSMPPTDTHFKYLLGAGLQKNASLREIVFVDPNKDGVEARAREVLETGHLRGVLRVESQTTATYFLTKEARSQMRRSLREGSYYRPLELPTWAREGLAKAGPAPTQAGVHGS